MEFKAAAVNSTSCQHEKKLTAALEHLCDTPTETLRTRENAALSLSGIEKL
jgi:hypothetical protein